MERGGSSSQERAPECYYCGTALLEDSARAGARRLRRAALALADVCVETNADVHERVCRIEQELRELRAALDREQAYARDFERMYTEDRAQDEIRYDSTQHQLRRM